MNCISSTQYQLVVEGIKAGKSLREIMHFAGVSKPTIRKIKRGDCKPIEAADFQRTRTKLGRRPYEAALRNRKPPVDGVPQCIECDKPTMVRYRRLFALGMEDAKLPSRTAIDVSCGNPKCFAPEHVVLRQTLLNPDSKWSILVKQLEELPIDGEIYLAHEPNNERHTLQFASSLRDRTRIKFIIRSQRAGGFKIIRAGAYASGLLGCEAEYTTTVHPRMNDCVADPKNYSTFYLGFGSSWRNVLPVGARVPKCKERACAHPAFKKGLCRQHLLANGMRLKRGRVSVREVTGEKALLYVETTWKERKSFLGHYLQGEGHQRSYAERTNDAWWMNNVIAKGIMVPEVLTAATL